MSKILNLALTGLLALGLTAGCKSSGVAVTNRAQVMVIDIDGPSDLPNNFTDELKVKVANRGVNNLSNVEFTVEIPNELVVVSEEHGQGMELMMMETPTGKRLYHYMVGNIEVTQSSTARFQVRTAFGTLDRSSDIVVTAWQKDLPGNKLVETRHVKLRR